MKISNEIFFHFKIRAETPSTVQYPNQILDIELTDVRYSISGITAKLTVSKFQYLTEYSKWGFKVWTYDSENIHLYAGTDISTQFCISMQIL